MEEPATFARTPAAPNEARLLDVPNREPLRFFPAQRSIAEIAPPKPDLQQPALGPANSAPTRWPHNALAQALNSPSHPLTSPTSDRPNHLGWPPVQHIGPPLRLWPHDPGFQSLPGVPTPPSGYVQSARDRPSRLFFAPHTTVPLTLAMRRPCAVNPPHEAPSGARSCRLTPPIDRALPVL